MKPEKTVYNVFRKKHTGVDDEYEITVVETFKCEDEARAAAQEHGKREPNVMYGVEASCVVYEYMFVDFETTEDDRASFIGKQIKKGFSG